MALMIFLFVGGDFNCTEDANLDRNHLEPHPASSVRLKRLIESHELEDVWRDFNRNDRQYTWSHYKDNLLSLAGLDRFYCYKHHFGIFKTCWIFPVGLSDHCLLQCSFCIQKVKLHSAYWHFNTGLLHDKSFGETFGLLWASHRENKPRFSSVQQWWDIGKKKTVLSAVYLEYHQAHY